MVAGFCIEGLTTPSSLALFVAFAVAFFTPAATARTPPPAATAQCKDGTYSSSQTRSGTCSHHGGVALYKRVFGVVPSG